MQAKLKAYIFIFKKIIRDYLFMDLGHFTPIRKRKLFYQEILGKKIGLIYLTMIKLMSISIKPN